MDDLTKLSASKIAELIRTRAVSSVEVVEAHLRRIEELNPHLNAIVTLAPDALDQARCADEAVPRGREPSGAWHGVPVTIKDTIDTGGLRTTRGSKLYANFIPSQDAPAVARLRAAGAIVLGKTNASELALDYTADNLLFGRTNNPQALTHTPGGSSGGCAAAVAACLTPASVGSDLAGSIRIPAHFCGVLALKPTAASISLAGHLPPTSGAFSLGASFGPLARSVDDVELLFNVLTNETTEKHEGLRMPASVSERADKSKVSNSGLPDKVDVRGRRVAWYVDDGCVRVSEETRRAVELAAGALQDAGLVTREERPPGIEHGARVWFELFAPATERFLRASYAGREAEGGATVQTILARQVDKDALMEPLDKYFRAWMERDYLRARLIEWMNETPLIIAPVGAVAAFAHDARRVKVDEQEVSVFRAFSYAQTFNVFDLPAMCVPVARSQEGLPIGVQIVGRPFAERETFAAARILENAFGGWQRPAGIKAL